MKIELYQAEHLSQKGSSLQSMIMNKDMPILDLLVRESLQNSLDANDPGNPSKFVNVDFITGHFDRDSLDAELEDISFKKRALWGNKYLAVRDSNTTGLTGEHDDKKSNLYKLVFGIMDAQQASGAGGSWGIGKTVYFRVGVGLVLYYSRVKKGDDYESLLSAAFVEDETKSNSLLPAVKGQKYGIAWWGERIRRTDLVKETRSSSTIRRILNLFPEIKPYRGSETGTTIIIPFIDENYLLSHNQPRREKGEPASYWMSSIKDYLKISVQKWYAPRLNNKKYTHGKYLTVSIDGKTIGPSDFEPFFKLTQALYNKAAIKTNDADKIRFEDTDIKCELVRINSDIEPKEAGRVAFIKVNRKQLGMNPPSNKPSPYEYISSTTNEDDFGKPVIMFCRKPGMIVSYHIEDSWTYGIPTTQNDEYIIGFFVLNPNPKLLNISYDLSLEDYVRKSELADHTTWEDCDLGGIKPYIITKLRKRISKKITTEFEDIVQDNSKTEEAGLSNLLGRLLLPPDGFGRKPSVTPRVPSDTSSGTQRSLRYTYYVSGYTEDGLLLSVHVTTGKKKTGPFTITFEMDSVSGHISPDNWINEVGLELPLFISGIRVRHDKIDDNKVSKTIIISRDNAPAYTPLRYCLKLTTTDEWCGLIVSFDDEMEHSIDVDLTFDISIRRKDIKPLLSFDF